MKLNLVARDSNIKLQLPCDSCEELLKNLKRYNACALSFVFQYELDCQLTFDLLTLIFGIDQNIRIQEGYRELCSWLKPCHRTAGSGDDDLFAFLRRFSSAGWPVG